MRNNVLLKNDGPNSWEGAVRFVIFQCYSFSMAREWISSVRRRCRMSTAAAAAAVAE